MKRIILFSILGALTLVSNVAFSQLNERPKRSHDGFSHLKVVKYLNLSDDQAKIFNNLKYAHEIEAIDLRTEIKKNHAELKKMLADKYINADEILKLTNESSKLHGDLLHGKTKMWLELYNILNEEQKEKWIGFLNHFPGEEMRCRLGENRMWERGSMRNKWDKSNNIE